MNLSQLAERILTGTTLESKFQWLRDVTSDAPSRIAATPTEPGRPPELQFRKGRGQPFPSRGKLDQAEARGAVFHYFANHELLALELMALCLMKFPDAPRSFQLAVASALREEQQHLGLYLKQMQRLGVAFGSMAPNRFFWTCLSPMKSPIEFVAGMSLTLEQANLDYALHFQKVFEQVGDLEAAAVMAQVLKDEIGHVQLGMTWLNHWKAADETAWDFYCKTLPSSLTPRRAKGLSFSAESRVAAGIPTPFIEKLRVFSHSRGRPPLIYWFDAGFEASLAHGTSWTPPKALQTINHDFSLLAAFLAGADDSVVVPAEPDTNLLRLWQDWGFEIPHFVAATPETPAKLRAFTSTYPAAGFEPWGWSWRSESFFNPCGGKPPLLIETLSELARKDYAARLLTNFLPTHPKSADRLIAPSDCPVTCINIAQFDQARQNPDWKRHATLVVKAPLGTAGQAMHIITREGPLKPQIAGWIQQVITSQGSVLIEPWLARTLDLSYQIVVGEAGPKLIDWTVMLNDHAGRFRGHRLARRLTNPSHELSRLFFERAAGNGASGFLELLEAAALWAGSALWQRGYRGPAGIDAFLFQDESKSLKLRPIVEINPRYTMGRIALALEKRLDPSTHAIWLHATNRQIKRATGLEPAKWFEHMMPENPMRLKPHSSGPPVVSKGFLPLVDIKQDPDFHAVLVAGEEAMIDNLLNLFFGHPLSTGEGLVAEDT